MSVGRMNKSSLGDVFVQVQYDDGDSEDLALEE